MHRRLKEEAEAMAAQDDDGLDLEEMLREMKCTGVYRYNKYLWKNIIHPTYVLLCTITFLRLFSDLEMHTAVVLFHFLVRFFCLVLGHFINLNVFSPYC